MNTRTLSIAATLCVPALLAFQPRGTSVSFGLGEGVSKTKVFSTVMTLNLDDMVMLMNGQEAPATPSMELTTVATTSITVTDEYVKMRDGAPAKLKRTYDTLEQSEAKELEMEIMSQVTTQDLTTTSTSELEGLTVLFSWSAEEEVYTAKFPNDDGDEELLEGLTEDMDLRRLLPEGEVSEGDEWKLEPVDLRDILASGGDLKFVPEESDEEDMMSMGGDMGSNSDWFNEDLEGTVNATFAGTRESEDGVKVGVIKVAFELTNAIDFTEDAQEALEGSEMPPGVTDMSINSVDVEIALEGEATLLWNMAEGYLHSFELSSDLGMTMDISMSLAVPGTEMEMDQSLEFSGTMTSSVSVE